MARSKRSPRIGPTSPRVGQRPPLLSDPEPESRLLDEVLSSRTPEKPVSALYEFLGEPSPWSALCRWLGLQPGAATIPSRDEVVRRLGRDITRIDQLLTRQVNAILHHPAFQKLEASWRGIRFLVDSLPEDESVKIRVLSVTWKELEQDLTNALEFDQTQLFRKVYEAEFGHPGGEPFGVLLGDFEIRHRRTPEHPQDDLGVLDRILEVAAAAFAPFIAGVHPSFFGLDGFTDLERPLNLPRTFEQVEYLRWRSLRQREDARFAGLTLPRVLMRLPYDDDTSTSLPFRFREEVGGPDCRRYLWGNASFAFGAVVMRCFAESGWLADIRGVRQGVDADGMSTCLEEAGLVTDLPVHSFRTDVSGLAIKCSTDTVITDSQERAFGELGFIPLCHCYDTEFSAFYGNHSIQRPKEYDEPAATMNARLSAMLQYILCVSRFAHFIKVISRDQLGSTSGAERCEEILNTWLRKYTTASENAGPETKARCPLREAKVKLTENRDNPGSYSCIIHLRPHFQLDQMITTMRFTTELAPARPS